MTDFGCVLEGWRCGSSFGGYNGHTYCQSLYSYLGAGGGSALGW